MNMYQMAVNGERERNFYKQYIEVSAIRLCSPFSNILYDLLSHDRSTTLHNTGISLMVVTTRLKWPKSTELGCP